MHHFVPTYRFRYVGRYLGIYLMPFFWSSSHFLSEQKLKTFKLSYGLKIVCEHKEAPNT